MESVAVVLRVNSSSWACHMLEKATNHMEHQDPWWWQYHLQPNSFEGFSTSASPEAEENTLWPIASRISQLSIGLVSIFFDIYITLSKKSKGKCLRFQEEKVIGIEHFQIVWIIGLFCDWTTRMDSTSQSKVWKCWSSNDCCLRTEFNPFSMRQMICSHVPPRWHFTGGLKLHSIPLCNSVFCIFFFCCGLRSQKLLFVLVQIQWNLFHLFQGTLDAMEKWDFSLADIFDILYCHLVKFHQVWLPHFSQGEQIL